MRRKDHPRTERYPHLNGSTDCYCHQHPHADRHAYTNGNANRNSHPQSNPH